MQIQTATIDPSDLAALSGWSIEKADKNHTFDITFNLENNRAKSISAHSRELSKMNSCTGKSDKVTVY